MVKTMEPSAHDSHKNYSLEMNVSSNRLLRGVWLVLGLLFTGLGFVGAFLPLMPTTVFLLIAAFFFARSSSRFYAWLLNNRMFGSLIRDWRAGLGMPLRAKILAVTLIVLTMGSSILIISIFWVRILLACVGVGVSTYLITRPTKKS